MGVKATVLAENSVYSTVPGLIAEHGWSVFIETPAGNYLLDTGAGKAVAHNARLLGIDLKSITAIILSHHHYDHTGGLMEVLERTGPVNVFAHPDLFKESYSLREGVKRYIGVPFRQEALEAKGARFCFNRDYLEIGSGVYITGEVPRTTAYESGVKELVVPSSSGYVQDALWDDQSLLIKSQKGLFAVLGCSHAGIINTLRYMQSMSKEEGFNTVIGGTHLGPAGPEQKEKSVQALKELKIGRLGVSHCTGLPVATRLAQEFQERFFFCNVGTIVEIA